MCGIVGATGTSQAMQVVLEGLKRLEYRGYDSAGIAVATNTGCEVRKEAGKMTSLEQLIKKNPLPAGSTAIGHSRWATHGPATSQNAHPHQQPGVTLVHNGIIENYQELKDNLLNQGFKFKSDTDTEVVAALLSQFSQEISPLEALQKMLSMVTGAFALGIVFEQEPDTLYAARRGAPLVIGLGEKANYLASDPLALAPETSRFMFLDDNELAAITPEKVTVIKADGSPSLHSVQVLDLTGSLAGKAGYPHFMLKEIHEQPAVVGRILSNYLQGDQITLPELPFDATTVPHISIVACGTAYLAGVLGKTYFEQLAGLRVEVDMASEFRYRQPPLQKGGVFIAVSQSGETADTLAALEYAKANGQHIVTLTNTPTSSMARASDVVIPLHAEAEIAVASTKAFTAMVTTLLLFALQLARANGRSEGHKELLQALRELPNNLQLTLNDTQPIQRLAEQLVDAQNMLYLGRGALSAIAYEGALKIKEISYIHAEAYPAGEMKHGPIALVEQGLPVVNLAVSNDGLFDKTLSNLQEVKARHGQVILISDEAGLEQAGNLADETLSVPTTHPLLMPLLITIPLQLLAYHVAVAKGTDVDQPRNLAKSVTVE